MKRCLTIVGLMAVMAGFAWSCQDPLIDGFEPTVKEGYVSVSFSAQIPDMGEIKTRAVDPDGEDITKLILFCFNERGLFVSAETVTPVTSSGFTGTYSVDLPVVTDRVHIIANLHKTIDENVFLGKSESEVLSTMTGSSGMMSYWARVVKGSHADIKTAFETDYNPVMLLRDHARITVEDTNGLYTDLAFVAVNTNAFGTVAPFNEGRWVAPSLSDVFVTLPESDLKVTGITDVVSVDSRRYQYVFETENSSDSPVCVIVRGTRNGTTRYFRVMLIDNEGEFVPVMRNFTYTVGIKGELDYGRSTFEEALTAPATNNVWLSVSDNIKEVSSSEYALAVEETHIVIGEDDPVFNTIHKQYTVHYSLKSLTDENLTSQDAPVITWLDGNNVAQHTIDVSEFIISADGKTAEGQVYINLLSLGGDIMKREGTLLIKKGLLERKVKIISVAKQSFTPSWITTNIYGGSTGENVTMMFHISESCPEELFPIDVLVSVNDMDVRNESGMMLPIIKTGEEGYGEDNGIGYKYVLTVTEYGPQRLYLETLHNHEVGDYVNVRIEAEHFHPLTKTATFQSSDNDNRILIHSLRSYVAELPADEVIYYYLVPQKIHAEVEFPAHLGQVYKTRPALFDEEVTDASGKTYWVKYVEPNVDFTDDADGYNVDEFLLYSQNLEHNHDKPAGTYYFDFYKDQNPANWSETAGRVLGFFRNTSAGTPGQGATMHLRTTKPKADEIVRIASNVYGAPSVTRGTKGDKAAMDYNPVDAVTGQKLCTGTGLYKSCIFELSTFHPFHFSAQVKKDGEVLAGSAEYGKEQPIDEDITLSYEPGQSVDVEFDVTSFTSSIENESAANQVSVDPFGTSFDIYIDAPTLELDEVAAADLISAGKLRIEGTRVIYTVDGDRSSERTYFSGMNALAVDNATKEAVNQDVIPAPDQSGERKVIRFRTNDIVSAGTVTLSSDESKVVYYTKTFNIQNEPIKGVLTYGGGLSVPAGTFVPFSSDDDTRIGVVSVTDSGTFELRLRSEYEFDWEETPVKFECQVGSVEYKAEFSSLKALYDKVNSAEPAIELIP